MVQNILNKNPKMLASSKILHFPKKMFKISKHSNLKARIWKPVVDLFFVYVKNTARKQLGFINGSVGERVRE